MKRVALIVLLLLGGVLVGVWLTSKPPGGTMTEHEAPSPQDAVDLTVPENGAPSAAVPIASERPPVPLLGETILAGYGNTNLPPENDLALMSRLMENSLLLLKSAGNRPLSANEDWADLLRGRNAAAERFLPDAHPAVNAQGQLVDRWQTPLFFHALGGGRYDLRSAGPDRKLWTEDDIHRDSNGRFRHGDALNPGSLLESDIRW